MGRISLNKFIWSYPSFVIDIHLIESSLRSRRPDAKEAEISISILVPISIGDITRIGISWGSNLDQLHFQFKRLLAQCVG